MLKSSALRALLIASVALGCATPDTAEHANAGLESVYRTANAVDEAVRAARPREHIGQLVQSLATEVQIAKKGQLGESDRRVVEAYEEVLAAYRLGLDLWDAQVQRQTQGDGGDDIPVKVGTMALNGFAGAERYNLPISTTVAANGVEIKVVPADSVQQMWTIARASLDKATTLYRGRVQ